MSDLHQTIVIAVLLQGYLSNNNVIQISLYYEDSSSNKIHSCSRLPDLSNVCFNNHPLGMFYGDKDMDQQRLR